MGPDNRLNLYSKGRIHKNRQCRKVSQKNHSSKGTSTKAHTFVIGVLISPRGIRYPLRFSYYTKEYCKEKGIELITQNNIAAELYCIFRKMLPRRVKLVVLADNFFDSKIMFNAVERSNIVYITPADSDRT